MTDRDKRNEPGTADGVRPVKDTSVSAHERAAAARGISADLRQLKHRAEAQNLKMVAYLLNLAELEALDCATTVPEKQRSTGNRCA